ncbi:MAG: glutamate--cysteine ligase [Oceanicaulis sp.]|uniref:glutamate--cysteine ligase n=1 Tax=unclassified Oceanicaulis TaxID=2632123 RepID=UPI000C4F6911|nr:MULTISPECIES: glutamate--cysteine ligase [unclassified Oceanicaulis]MAB70081.1 glutamate--cysteine ligase [Oceanicaulis sp.]MBC39525.1 glutamate--cysteine ligase [Oceanicaulis sp.]HBU62229.1 glutamate--cysteine ligase [Oceanicaulis sp.]HCR93558.1 glutamate--cysteine ligase [Oceanicaulis sp.]|tara:strand:- start:242 stop:1615 length:1374 start_codon:yes stop_codon:yes gene_type:complete
MSGTYNAGGEGAPIESKAQLIGHIAAGEKPKDQWRIGTEHEKFGFALKDHAPLPYEGQGPSVRKLLEGLTRFGWQAIEENGKPVALKREGGSITLEPGGQFELSGAPLENLHETCREVNTHLREVREVADEVGAGFLGLGFSPKWSLEETPMMPKDRYNIMKAYMPKVGTLGHQMMFRSCTVQTNLDFASEADMVKKMRVSLALQPIATALFANSPFADGKPNGYLSYRAHVWTDTDNNRTGMLHFAFDEGFGYEQYVDWALDAPMYFVKRNSVFQDATGLSFRDFLKGELPLLPGELPVLSDWEDHLSTLFPEVRLKTFLEQRGADGGPWNRLCALPAFWVGLLYDQTALDAAWDLVKDWTAEERDAMRAGAAKTALKTPFRNTTLQDIAQQALAISRSGLKARQRLNAHGENEALFLDDLDEIAKTGVSPAERLLERYHGAWNESVEPIFEEAAY